MLKCLPLWNRFKKPSVSFWVKKKATTLRWVKMVFDILFLTVKELRLGLPILTKQLQSLLVLLVAKTTWKSRWAEVLHRVNRPSTYQIYHFRCQTMIFIKSSKNMAKSSSKWTFFHFNAVHFQYVWTQNNTNFRITIVKDEKRRSRGVAFIQFLKIEDAESCTSINNTEVSIVKTKCISIFYYSILLFH